ncbi:hypothetical protein BJ165DRAFT_1520606 [Panaeolus papilionaceus]|nr:hypothetical protein BJ165DRAFT_1520606 [Panaeolus papilionaceus]
MLKLNDDWSNWSTYKTVTLAQLYSRDLAGHIQRNVKPATIIYHRKDWYLASDIEYTRPIGDGHIVRSYHDDMDKYLKNEGIGTLILVFQQISHLDTLKQKWDMLEMFYGEIKRAWDMEGGKPVVNQLEDRWNIQRHLLHRLQSTKYLDGPLVKHINKVIDLRSKLASCDIEVTNSGLARVLQASVFGTKFELDFSEDKNGDQYAPFKFERYMEALFELEEMSLHSQGN